MESEVPGRRCVLVTGVTGLVGRAVAARFLAAGWKVRGAVRRSLGDTETIPDVEYAFCGSVGPTTSWSRHLEGVEVIVHAAAHAHVTSPSASDLALFNSVNVEGTGRLAEEARAVGVRRVVLVSSAAVLGSESVPGRPLRSCEGFLPEDPYALSKLAAERALQRALAGGRTDWVVVRPPLIHGPGARGNLRRLQRLISAGVPLPFGAIRNRRSLVGVTNLADAIYLLATHQGAALKSWAVTDSDAVSTPQLVRWIGEASGGTPILLPVPAWLVALVAGVFGQRSAWRKLVCNLEVDGSEIRDQLGWRPPLSLRDGLLEAFRA